MDDQESHSGQSRFATKTGITLEELASQCRERYLVCAGIVETPAPWEEDDVGDKSKWMEASETVGEFIAQEITTTFKSIAQRFSSIYVGPNSWDTFQPEEKLAFEACVRHITNVVTAEDRDDVKDALEYNWTQWVQDKKEKE